MLRHRTFAALNVIDRSVQRIFRPIFDFPYFIVTMNFKESIHRLNQLSTSRIIWYSSGVRYGWLSRTYIAQLNISFLVRLMESKTSKIGLSFSSLGPTSLRTAAGRRVIICCSASCVIFLGPSLLIFGKLPFE